MRTSPLLLPAAALVMVACAVPQGTRPGVVAPVEAGGAPVAGAPWVTPAPGAPPVLQVIPPGNDVRWGGAGGALAISGRSCETSIVDAAAGRVTARLAACEVWPSPTRDVFLAHLENGLLVTFYADGTRGAMLPKDWTPGGEVTWGADGMVPEMHGRTTPPVIRDRNATLSPDGAWKATSAADTRTPSVDVVDLATRKVVLHLRGMVDPRWSADGLYLSARGEDGHAPSLVVFAAGTWKEVWRRQGTARGTWSTVGAHLAVTSEAGGLELLDAPTATTHVLPSATTAWFERLYQAPDGALMAPMVPRADGRSQAVRVAGDTATVVDLPAEALEPGWSPDGSWRVVRADRQGNPLMVPSWALYVDDPATKAHRFVDHGYGGYDAEWSARAHRLLVVHGDAVVFDADTSRVWKVPVSAALSAAMDADGARAAIDTPEGLQVVKLASKEPPVMLKLRDDRETEMLALSGDRVAAVTRGGDVSVWSVEGHAVVASWKAGFAPEHVAWLGEGKRLALSRREVLRLSDADGSNAVTVMALRNGGATSLLAENAPR
jgi:hypothetical protein